MKIIKEYETIINLSATEMYSDNINNIIMDKLKQRFEGKCEGNSFIVQINGIIRRSGCMLAKSRLDGSGDINVQFTTESIIYNDDDILTGCEIKIVEKGKIICKHDIAVINIAGNKTLQSLKQGQKITIRISSVSYLKGKDNITIHGIPYSYSYKFNIYSTSFKSIPSENIEILKKKIQEINTEYSLYEKLDKKDVKFFNNVYYPFKEPYEKSKTAIEKSKIKIINAYDLANEIVNSKIKESDKKIFLLKHIIIDKSTPDIFQIEEADLKTELSGNIINASSYEINIINENIIFSLLYFLNDHLSHIRAIREMTDIYPTETERNHHINIWEIFNRLKR